MNKEDKRIDHVVPGQALAVKVIKTKRHPEGDVNRAVLQWKRMIKDSKILDTVKERQEYKKKSVRRREELDRASYQQKRYDANNF